MTFDLLTFSAAMGSAFDAFPEEHAGHRIEVVASWIADDSVRVVCRSEKDGESSLWGFRSIAELDGTCSSCSEQELASRIFFHHIAGDFPAQLSTSDGLTIDWRNSPGDGEPQTLAQVQRLPGVLMRPSAS